jgi:glycosyltransferase involved in cell wall biosynthesis
MPQFQDMHQFMDWLGKKLGRALVNPPPLPEYVRPKDPQVIVLMPVHNISKYWPQVSGSLYRLDPQPSLYVFAENNSTDDTLKLVSQFDRPKEILRFWFRDDAIDFCETWTDIIGIVRQFLLQRARKLDPDFAIFLDSDISVTSTDLIDRLTRWGDSCIVGGPYRLAHGPTPALVMSLHNLEFKWVRKSGLEEVFLLAGGCVCLPRKAIQDRRLKFYPVRCDRYKGLEFFAAAREAAFVKIGLTSWYLPEDEAFAWRAFIYGYRLFVDWSIYLDHLSWNEPKTTRWRLPDGYRDPLREELFRRITAHW